MEQNKENVIEFLSGQDIATVTFSQKKYTSKIKRLAAKFPDECKIVAYNLDGSICATVPLSWIKISHPKRVSEAQREAAKERLANGRKKKREEKERSLLND